MKTNTYNRNVQSSASSLIRHEAKYVIPPSLVPQIKEFIEPFCTLDRHCHGAPPEYIVTTLQLDTPDLALHHAKERESLNRFKLRIRTYGLEPVAPVFLEIKQKQNHVTKKSRASMAADKWSGDIILDPGSNNISFRTREEETCYLDFVRLVMETGARPVVLIRYNRTSFFGTIDHYARVTFDRNLVYQPTRSWELWNTEKNWFAMDSTLTQNKMFPFSGIVLELKCLCNAPQWMIDLTERFGLERTGHCKYSNALWEEALFTGTPDVRRYGSEMFY
ncbi:polyphosphate polymerase domain-containing protein [Verrucomicrobiota bacterium]